MVAKKNRRRREKKKQRGLGAKENGYKVKNRKTHKHGGGTKEYQNK
jgi:hypothetical protein